MEEDREEKKPSNVAHISTTTITTTTTMITVPWKTVRVFRVFEQVGFSEIDWLKMGAAAVGAAGAKRVNGCRAFLGFCRFDLRTVFSVVG